MKTKDYIYLDEDLLNSHLAQFEKGLLTKETSEHGTESSDSLSESGKATAGLNGIFGIGAKLQSEVIEGDSSTESEFTKNIVENVLSDYAVDLLIQDCSDNYVLHDFGTAKEGDFISYSSEFQIYDFEYLESSAASPKPGPQASKEERTAYRLKEAQEKSKQEGAKKNLTMLNVFSTFADRLFADSILIKFHGGIAICKRNKLRLNKAQISFENESKRKIKIFGVISTVKEKTDPTGNFSHFASNQLDRISSVLFDVTLSNFDMLHDNDKIIKPIAIYFEAE